MEERHVGGPDDLFRRIYEKELVVAERNRGMIPYTTVDGRFDDWSNCIGWWTNGFYAGMFWELYRVEEAAVFREEAERIEQKLDQCFTHFTMLDHDNGFKWLPTAVMNYTLTGNEASRDRGILAASCLAGRYNPAGQFLRAWNDTEEENRAGWVIIDSMMNLPLLYWASEVTKDPRFGQIARNHADTVRREFIRENGSAHHIVVFDPDTGKRVRALGGQGMDENSSWTRGQSWAFYGFVQSYSYTKESRYLETAIKVAEYILAELKQWEFMPVDFKQDSSLDWEDSTAAAIMACGFLELAEHVEGELWEQCCLTAVRLVKTLAEHRCNFDSDTDNLLEKCSAAYHDSNHNFPIIYGDYYFIKAIIRLMGQHDDIKKVKIS